MASNSLSKKYKNCVKISGRTARILKLAGFHLWMYMEKKYLVTYAGTFFFLILVKDTCALYCILGFTPVGQSINLKPILCIVIN